MTRDPNRRVYVGLRLRPDGYKAIQQLAAQETDGNLSEMVRRLLSEAIMARRTRQ